MKMMKNVLKALAIGLAMVSFSSCSCSWEKPKPEPEPDPTPQTIPVETISFGVEKTSFYVGETVQITNLQINPSNATNKKVMYTSQDISVAKIVNDSVQGINPGSTYIVGYSVAYPNVTFKVKVDVIKREVPVSKLTIELPREEMEVDETITASVSVSPEDATNKEYELIASPSDFVSIDGNKIKALKTGIVRLQAKSKSNDVVSNSVYLDIKKIAAKGINLECNKTTLLIGETADLTYKVIPDNVEDKQVAFKTDSGTNNVIEISSTGIVTAKEVGEDYAIAYMVNKPEVWNKIKFTVTEVEVNKINLYATRTQLEVDETVQLTAEVLPNNATFKEVGFKTKSGNNNIISVSSSGLVTANAIGKDSVVCYSIRKPSIETEIEIEVIETPIVIIDVTKINLTAAKTDLNVFEQIQLTTEVLPVDATNKAVTYSTKSGNNNVIQVSNTGLVTAVAKGKDTVICKSVSKPDIFAEVTFNVSEVEAESINVEKTSVELKTSDTYQINATVMPLNATYKDVSYKLLDRNDYSDKGDRFESSEDYTYNASKPFVLNDIVNIDVWFDAAESTQKFTIMFGQGWAKYFGYYDIFSDGTLGGNYAGVTVSEPVEGMFRFSFDLSSLNKQNDKPLPDEYVDIIYIRGSWSTASGNIKVNTSIKSDILSVSNTGLVSAFNLGEQTVRVYNTKNPNIYKDITFNVKSNPNDPMGDDVYSDF